MPIHDPRSGLHDLESGRLGTLALRVDFLSQVLTLIRLRGELVFSADLSAPWALRFEPGAAWFHLVEAGELALTASDGRAITATAGDLVILPQGFGHTIGTPGAEPVSARTVLETLLRKDELAITLGGGGPVTRIIAGAYRFEGDNLPDMLAVLPSVIHLPASAARGGWLDGLAQTMLAEARSPAPGATIMISRLVDVLMIRAMRLWVATAEPEDKGWIGALADPRISRALKAIHDDPFRRYTVADLATLAGMSRSSFAERFTMLIGAAPLHYQTRWKLLLAQEMLKRADTRVSDVARHVGYDSDAAFSRAFKAQFGFAPSARR